MNEVNSSLLRFESGMAKRQQRKRKDSRNKPDLEARASAAATATPGPLRPGGPSEKFRHRAHQHDHQYSSQRKEFTCGEIQTEFDLRPLRESCIVILNNILTVLFFVLKVAFKILAFLLFLFRTLVLLSVVVAVILFGLFSITFAAYHTIVEILKDFIPEQFIHPFQVIGNIILTVVPPLVEPTIRYILAPIQYFATGDREKYDTIINGLNEINEELFLHEHLGLERDDHQLDNLNEADNIASADSSEIESDFEEDGDDLDYIDSEAEIVFGQPEFCPCCGNHAFLEEDSAADSEESSIPDFDFVALLKGSKKMDLVDNLITDEILKNFKDVYMHPECGLRVRSFIRYDGRVAEYSYCLNDKFGDRVIFKNRESPICLCRIQAVLDFTCYPSSTKSSGPLLRLARPPDIPLLMQQSRSYDAHLRYHGIEQMYLLYLRHDLRDMLEEVGLMDVCIDTLARKHADARTRHLCTLILKEMLANNVLLCKLTQSWFGQLNKSSPKEYLKKGTGKLNKLLAAAPYKVFGKSASERYATAYDLWSASIEKVLALPWKEQKLPLPHKKNVMKNLAHGIRVCKMGCTDAAKAKSGKDEKKNPSHIFGVMAAEVLKESADNLDAHLVAVFCEELKHEFEEAVEKTDVALDLFPDDPWVLVLRAQSTQNIRCCDDTDQHVVNAMTVAWRAFQKEGVYTIECYETFLYSLFAESKYSLAYDVAIEAIEKVPIDDKRYANIAYMLAILHLSDLYHPDRAADPERLDPIKGFVKYYKLGLKSHEFYEEIWQGMQECRYGGQANRTAEYLKKFMMFPIEMRTLMNNVPYYCHKVRAGNEGNVEGRMKQCKVCGVPEVERVLRKCSRCRVIHYCSVGCQQKDWPQHKTNCKKT